MNLNIEPLKIDFINCFEGLIISFASWCKCNYELMFADSWGFSYSNECPTSTLQVGERINAQKSIHFGFLEQYHGIKIVKCFDKTPEEILDIIQSQLMQGYPTIIYLNPFWCPWDERVYQKNKNARTHAFLVTGVDPVNKNMYCVDTTFMKQNVILPMDHYQNGCAGSCVTLNTVDNVKGNIDLDEILGQVVIKLRKKSGSFSVFDEIRQFSDDVRRFLDISTEITDRNRIWTMPLIFNLSEMINGRVNFRKMLRFTEERNKMKELKQISEAMTELDTSWSSVRGILIKGYFNNNPIKEKVADIINQIAVNEENVLIMVEKLLGHNPDISSVKIESNIKTKVKNQFEEITYVELKKYLNNHTFGDPYDNECKADMSGLGYFLYIDPLSRERFWKIPPMKFFLADITEATNDSIACVGQTITVPEGRFSNIMILGCSDLGSFSDEIAVEYQDNTKQKLPLQFTDHAVTQELFGETLAWRGKCGFSNEYGNAFESKIYAQMYDLEPDKITKSISLPNCSNIIIFAISFGR